MLRSESFQITQIYVPVKRRRDLKPDLAYEIAESILEIGQQTPILVRRDRSRLILVDGLHRLEACKALGEDTIFGQIVQSPATARGVVPAFEAQLESIRQRSARLKQLRLSKEAPEPPHSGKARTQQPMDKADVLHGTRASSDMRRGSQSKSRTLLEWLAQRRRDGFQT